MKYLTAKGFAPPIVLVILTVIILAAGFYFYTSNFNKPAQIKQKAEIVQPIFKDYKNSIEDVIDHLEEQSESDTDSYERYIKKGEGFLKIAEENNKTIKSEVDRLSLSDFSEYKKKIEEYIASSEEVLTIEKDELSLGSALIDPLRDYEDLTTGIQGINNYIYSDPTRYIKEVEAAIGKGEAIIDKLKGIKVNGDSKYYLEALLKTYELELELFEKAKAAVEKRDNNALTQATKEFNQSHQEISKEVTKLHDDFDNKINGYKDNLKDLFDLVEDEYSKLKQRYNF